MPGFRIAHAAETTTRSRWYGSGTAGFLVNFASESVAVEHSFRDESGATVPYPIDRATPASLSAVVLAVSSLSRSSREIRCVTRTINRSRGW